MHYIKLFQNAKYVKNLDIYAIWILVGACVLNWPKDQIVVYVQPMLLDGKSIKDVRLVFHNLSKNTNKNINETIHFRNATVIHLVLLTGYAIMKPDLVFVELAMTVQNVINVLLDTTGIQDVDHVPVTMLEVNQVNATKLCVVVMNLGSVNAR